MNETHHLDQTIEVWKKTIDVQQHFNDIEMRIRNYALTLIAAILGAVGYALKEGLHIDLPWTSIFALLIMGIWFAVTLKYREKKWVVGVLIVLALTALAVLFLTKSLQSRVVSIPLGCPLGLAGLAVWIAFYFMDRYWYHPLLLGAVNHGKMVEDALRPFIPVIGLTTSIGDSSPVHLFNKTLHSSDKMKSFYYGIGTLLLFVAVFAALCEPVNKSDQQRVEITRLPEIHGVLVLGAPTAQKTTRQSDKHR